MVRTLANQFGVLERSEEQQHPQQNYRYRSVVNRKILDEYETGCNALRKGDCKGAATDSYRDIVHFMRVPWIQGGLKLVFLLSESNNIDVSSIDIDINDNTLQQERRPMQRRCCRTCTFACFGPPKLSTPRTNYKGWRQNHHRRRRNQTTGSFGKRWSTSTSASG